MFKKGDIVKVLNNKLTPDKQGKIGKISKVYSTFENNGETLYRVNVKGRLVKGLAKECDLSLICSGEE